MTFKILMKSRIAVLDKSLCTKEICGYVCVHICPVNRMGKECIKIDEEGYPIISEELCSGCGICPKRCPVNAIKIINLSRELDNPIYQYGVNSFRLYGLPLPSGDLNGAISLVGRNGLGKTTALRILGGKIIPNFGEFDKTYTSKEVLLKMSPEMKKYFSSLFSNHLNSSNINSSDSLSISFKPQKISDLRNVFDGTVLGLLKKTIPKDKIDTSVKLFNLENILNRKVEHLSGGELQKLAITITYSKDSDLYYFDEISNFLDIKERLNVAIILKDFSENNSVILVDHDLTLLDYVSNYIYLFYGEEGAYGVVSGLKNVRTGINEYLKGYLSSENMRFRDYEISFSTQSETELNTKTKFEYTALKKSFVGFEFSSDSGKIREGEIIGIVGKNALGKSLFMKLLVGKEKADEGESASFSISYKPQYIEVNRDKELSNTFVKDYIKTQNTNPVVLESCKQKLVIASLMEKKLSVLSGGELQRVALVRALSIDADVYLFDEPSAFLDIEQRFAFSKLLRRTISDSAKSAFVVDHDIVFIDSIANRLIPFDGESSLRGHAGSPMSKGEGMNKFLSMSKITMRRDKDSNRPRINKPDSRLDREQKSLDEYYYSK